MGLVNSGKLKDWLKDNSKPDLTKWRGAEAFILNLFAANAPKHLFTIEARNKETKYKTCVNIVAISTIQDMFNSRCFLYRRDTLEDSIIFQTLDGKELLHTSRQKDLEKWELRLIDKTNGGKMDICSNKHKGNLNSIEANKRTRKHKDRAKIIDYIRERKTGATVYEISQALGIRYQTASARCSELKAEKIIEATEERRKTDSGSYAAVLKVIYV